MDIGAPAILFLIDAWEGHLTPPEAAGIADKVRVSYSNYTSFPLTSFCFKGGVKL